MALGAAYVTKDGKFMAYVNEEAKTVMTCTKGFNESLEAAVAKMVLDEMSKAAKELEKKKSSRLIPFSHP